MNIKEFMQQVLEIFIAKADAKRVNEHTGYWTDGICIAITVCYANRRDSGDYSAAIRLCGEAETLLHKHKPDTNCAFWWPCRKDSCTFEEAMSPRLEVLSKVINSL